MIEIPMDVVYHAIFPWLIEDSLIMLRVIRRVSRRANEASQTRNFFRHYEVRNGPRWIDERIVRLSKMCPSAAVSAGLRAIYMTAAPVLVGAFTWDQVMQTKVIRRAVKQDTGVPIFGTVIQGDMFYEGRLKTTNVRVTYKGWGGNGVGVTIDRSYPYVHYQLMRRRDNDGKGGRIFRVIERNSVDVDICMRYSNGIRFQGCTARWTAAWRHGHANRVISGAAELETQQDHRRIEFEDHGQIRGYINNNQVLAEPLNQAAKHLDVDQLKAMLLSLSKDGF